MNDPKGTTRHRERAHSVPTPVRRTRTAAGRCTPAQRRRQAHDAYWRHRPPRYCVHCHQLIDPTREPHQHKYHRACAQVIRRQQAAAYQRTAPRTATGKAAHRRAARAYQLRHLAQGLCVYCPRKARPGAQACRQHDRRGR
jgi:hypothetical protein